MRVLAAPGPVSYPVIVNNRGIELSFSKDGTADVVLDSTVSLAKRGLKINYITVKGLLNVYPKVGKRIGVPKILTAANVLTKALIEVKKLDSRIVSIDDMQKIMNSLKEGEVDSVVVPSGIVKGITFEELLGIPGSCGANVKPEFKDEFISLYKEGIDKFKEDPEGSALKVVSALGGRVSKEFVINTMKN
jgi:ABC-type amino acid transport substrate-binding protein